MRELLADVLACKHPLAAVVPELAAKPTPRSTPVNVTRSRKKAGTEPPPGQAASLIACEQLDSPGIGAVGGSSKALRTVAAHRLPTNTTTRSHPIHRWFNFIAGFSPEFVSQCCTGSGLGRHDLLLDPFAGCATAPLVASRLGIRAIGFEAHPVFARIARAKLPRRRACADLPAIKSTIDTGLKKALDLSVLPVAPREFLGKLFSEPTLKSLLGARESLTQQGLIDNDLAFLFLSRMVDKCSHSQTDGIYKAPTSRKSASDPLQVSGDTFGLLAEDLAAIENAFPGQHATIFDHSSEAMPEVTSGSVSIVVTSPPYLNNFDYAEMTRMLLYFWGMADSWGDITNKVRTRLIVNTTTALKGHKNRQDEYRTRLTRDVLPELDSLVVALRQRRAERAGKKEYDMLVYPYFAQMTAVLAECFRCLRPNGRIHLMVADAALYGVHISTPQVLATIMSALGFREVECLQVRTRGHRWELAKRQGSPTGLGEYHVCATR